MKNHFEILSLPVAFAVDLDALEKKYFEFQRQFHPDRASISEIEQSIAINESYEVLKNPLKRAAHILQLNGLDVENDEVAPKVDQATLLEVFEMREVGNFLAKDLNQKIKNLIDELARSLDHKDFAAAAQILIRAKYFEKMLKDLKANGSH
ncbi:MAG: Fe-S protein assembly co-chaperone HscB [Alphaproteobacteria bacterium]|nr:Fe-S protein assembly co-chaperone HscB [Alphaproteobacteria bacterium]